MDLNVEIQAVLPELRRMAESRMTSTVQIERSTGVQDELTGEFERETVYTGKARITTYEALSTEANIPGVTLTVQRYSVHLPLSAGRVEVDDLITVVNSPNQLLIGSRYRVTGPHEKDDQTAQRVLVDHMPSE